MITDYYEEQEEYEKRGIGFDEKDPIRCLGLGLDLFRLRRVC